MIFDGKSLLTEIRQMERHPWPRLAQNRRRPRPGQEIPGPAALRRRSAELEEDKLAH